MQIFQTAGGLPRNTVNCLVSGPTGLLWLCTSEGLVSFDGYGFRVMGVENGLPSREIEDFVPSRYGGYWAVTTRGVCRIRSDVTASNPCRPVPIEEPDGQFIPQSLVETASGRSWFATSTGLWLLSSDGKRWERSAFRLPPKDSPGTRDIRCMAEYKDGWLLIGTEESVYLWKPGSAALRLTESPVPESTWNITPLADGDIWIGMSSGLARLVDSPATSRPRLQHLRSPGLSDVRGLVQRRDGSVWVCSPSGVSRVEVKPNGEVREAEHYSESDGLPPGEKQLLLEDRQGGLWGGTIGFGVYRIGSSRITRYLASDGMGTYRIAAIFEDRNHELCVRSSYKGRQYFHVLRNYRFVPVGLRFPESAIRQGWGWNEWGLQSTDGQWFMPTGIGLIRFGRAAQAERLGRMEGSEVLNRLLGRSQTELFRLFEDHNQTLWMSTLDPNRLIRWERSANRVTAWDGQNGSPVNDVASVIRESSRGVLWIGTYGGGVYRYRADRFQAMRLPAPAGQIEIRDLLIDAKGRIWVATAHDGLLRCDRPDDAEPEFHRYTMADGLTTDSLRSLTEDTYGFIYAGTVRGVERIDPRVSTGGRQHIVHLTSVDGLPEAEQNVSYRDSRGHLWFGSLAGLAELVPSEAERSSPVSAYITRVRVRGEEVPLPLDGTGNLSLHLASSRNQLEVEYTGVDLRSAPTLRYQYRLGGLDTGWSDLQAHRSVNYARVPAGHFRFEVRAVNAESQVSISPAVILLTVDAPLWQRWWFVLFISAAAYALSHTAYQYRVSQLLEVERIRTRIATDLHDDIGASLSQISILSEVARRGSTPELWSDIANIARATVQEMSDIVWAVSPRHDRLESLVHRMRRFAADTLGAAEIGLDFQAEQLPHDLDTPLSIRRPLYLIFKEAINNIARHSGARRATVRLFVERPWLRMEISDDGCGFDPASVRDGEGRSNIIRRSHDLGGLATWDTAPGTGTHFAAALPLRPKSYLSKLMVRTTRK